MDLAAEAERLRTAAEAKPLKLPVNRRIDERHHAVTRDGLRGCADRPRRIFGAQISRRCLSAHPLSVWFTIQVSPHGRIAEAVFERPGGRPTDEETAAWLRKLLPGQEPAEAPGLPGGPVRRFEVFEGRRPGPGLPDGEVAPA
jgi:hypothetical protein